jgi:hypothetical protein
MKVAFCSFSDVVMGFWSGVWRRGWMAGLGIGVLVYRFTHRFYQPYRRVFEGIVDKH